MHRHVWVLTLLTAMAGCNALEARLWPRDDAGEPSPATTPHEPSAKPSSVKAAPPGRDSSAPRPGIEAIIGGSHVSLPAFLGGADALSIPISELRERLGLADGGSSAEATRIKLSSGKTVSVIYRLDERLRPLLTGPDRAAVPADAVELTIHPPTEIDAFVAAATSRWGAPVQTRVEGKGGVDYARYHWFDDAAHLAVRADGSGTYLEIAFYRYIPTSDLPAAFMDALRPHLGKPKGDGPPGSPDVDILGHRWRDSGESFSLLWESSALPGQKQIIHTFHLRLRFNTYPTEMDALYDAMRTTWGDPTLGCGRDKGETAYRFSTDPPVVAVRDGSKWTLWAFNDASRVRGEFRLPSESGCD